SSYLISPGFLRYLAASSSSCVPHVPRCTKPKKEPTGSPSRIMVEPEKISAPPVKAMTLFLFKEILKSVVQVKSPLVMLTVFTASSSPLFSILPILDVTVLYPLLDGTGALKIGRAHV